jgi:anti-sigma-K factor RskA
MTLNHEQVEAIAALQAIGAATPDEELSIEEHLAGCAECRRARDEFSEAATLLVRALDPITPPNGIRRRILSAVADRQQSEETPSGATFNPWWLATAATLFLALWGWREFGIRVARERLQSQQAEIMRLSEENARLTQRASQTRTIDLAGQEISPRASAKVFLQPDQRRAVVFFYDLPANATDKTYQLWLVRAGQTTPESLGVFDMNSSGRASMVVNDLPSAEDIKGLAVTLEPRGGAPQPSTDNYYLTWQS